MIFIETSVFTRQIKGLIRDDSYSGLQEFLARLPTAGDLIRGSNGCRKIRWKTPGRGKRGGIRVIYYWIKNSDQILMLLAYAKTTTGDLTSAQNRKLARLVTSQLKSY